MTERSAQDGRTFDAMSTATDWTTGARGSPLQIVGAWLPRKRIDMRAAAVIMLALFAAFIYVFNFTSFF